MDRFHAYVRPILNPTLSDFCRSLTGIQQVRAWNARSPAETALMPTLSRHPHPHPHAFSGAACRQRSTLAIRFQRYGAHPRSSPPILTPRSSPPDPPRLVLSSYLDDARARAEGGRAGADRGRLGQVLQRFEAWLDRHGLLHERRFALVTDGPWDFREFFRHQCAYSGIPLRPVYRRWINLRKVGPALASQRDTGSAGSTLTSPERIPVAWPRADVRCPLWPRALEQSGPHARAAGHGV